MPVNVQRTLCTVKAVSKTCKQPSARLRFAGASISIATLKVLGLYILKGPSKHIVFFPWRAKSGPFLLPLQQDSRSACLAIGRGEVPLDVPDILHGLPGALCAPNRKFSLRLEKPRGHSEVGCLLADFPYRPQDNWSTRPGNTYK